MSLSTTVAVAGVAIMGAASLLVASCACAVMDDWSMLLPLSAAMMIVMLEAG